MEVQYIILYIILIFMHIFSVSKNKETVKDTEKAPKKRFVWLYTDGQEIISSIVIYVATHDKK